MIQFKQYLTEIKQNELYKEFLKVQKNPQQMELPFEFDDEIFTSNQEIARHILRQLNFISIGFEFEMYLKRQGYNNIHLDKIHKDILETAHKYFDFNDDNKKLSNIHEDYLFSISGKAMEEFESLDIDEIYAKYKGVTPKEPIENDSKEYNDLYNKWYNDNIDNLSNEYTFEEYISNMFFSVSHFINKIGVNKLNDDYNEYYYNGKILTTDDGSDNEYERISKILEKKLGIDCRVFGEAHQSQKDSKKFWYIEPDESLNNSYEDYFPVEIVTKTYPAYKYKEVFNSLIKTLRKENYNPISDESTGLHFSISFNDKIANESIDYLKLIILGQDSFFLKKLGRNFNSFCHSQFKNVLRRIDNLTSEYGLLNKDTIIKENILEKLKDEIMTKIKYSSINFSKYQVESDDKFIEFRITGNDYLKEFKELSLRTIDWFLFIIIAASSKTLLEDEFYKKIEEISRRFV